MDRNQNQFSSIYDTHQLDTNYTTVSNVWQFWLQGLLEAVLSLELKVQVLVDCLLETGNIDLWHARYENFSFLVFNFCCVLLNKDIL